MMISRTFCANAHSMIDRPALGWELRCCDPTRRAGPQAAAQAATEAAARLRLSSFKFNLKFHVYCRMTAQPGQSSEASSCWHGPSQALQPVRLRLRS